LTPLLAGRPVVRESRDGGRNYHAKWQRPLTGRVLLSVPAAVPIYSAAGDTRVLVVDLDCSRGGRGQVLRDAAAIGRLVTAAGGRLISDESPSGGVHLYVPLAEPVGFYQARDVAKALAARAPSMDVTPNLGLTNGLIRPPGSRHRSKGFQVLHGPLDEAVAQASVGNPPVVWQRLSAELAPELAAQTTPPDLTSSTADLQGEGGRRVPRRGVGRPRPELRAGPVARRAVARFAGVLHPVPHRRRSPSSADRGLQKRRRAGHRRQSPPTNPDPCPPIPH